jgi:hypothetical protein
MNYQQMTIQQLEQEQSTRQMKLRRAQPSAYWKELDQLGRVQSLLAYRYQQSERSHVMMAERATSRR